MKKTTPKVVDITLCSAMTPMYTILVMSMIFSPNFTKVGITGINLLTNDKLSNTKYAKWGKIK